MQTHREQSVHEASEKRRPVDLPSEERLRNRRIPDLSGRTFGIWRVLYEAEVEKKRHYMCRCGRCGIKKIIPAIKLWKGYALKCRECRIRQDLLGACTEA